MIKYRIKLIRFVAISSILLLSMSQGFTREFQNSGPAAEDLDITVYDERPLALAREFLKQALTDHQAGKLDQAKISLEKAEQQFSKRSVSKDHKMNEEATRLAKQISEVSASISHDSAEKHGNAISRLWHRTQVLLGREIHQLHENWDVVSMANKRKKQLIDASLHLYYAEHDLFVSNDKKEAATEVDKCITYLKEAKGNSRDPVSARIERSIQDVERLKDYTPMNANSSADPVVASLKLSNENLETAEQIAIPSIKERITAIKGEISLLETDLASLRGKQHYDEILEEISLIIEELIDN